MSALDSFIGEGLVDSPYVQLKRQMPDNDWLLERRIAHEGYPACEARYSSIQEYVEKLESIIDDINSRSAISLPQV